MVTPSNDKVNDGPVLTASHIFWRNTHLRWERKTKFQSSRRRFGSVAFGHGTPHWPCFGLQQKPETGLKSSTFWVKTCFLGLPLNEWSWAILTSPISSIITRCRRWRCCSPTRRSSVPVGKSHKTDAKERSSATIAVWPERLDRCLFVFFFFSVETEQHELDPDGNGADEMMTDETPLDDENGGDGGTIVQKPLTSSERKVSQNVHNNWLVTRARKNSCGLFVSGPTRGSRLRATRVWVSKALGVDHFETESPDSSKIVFWCVRALWTNCVFVFWTKLLRLWQSALLNDGSSIQVLPCWAKSLWALSSKNSRTQTASSSHIWRESTLAKWPDRTTRCHLQKDFRARSLDALSEHFFGAPASRIDCPTVQATPLYSECSGLGTVFPRTCLTSDDV